MLIFIAFARFVNETCNYNIPRQANQKLKKKCGKRGISADKKLREHSVFGILYPKTGMKLPQI